MISLEAHFVAMIHLEFIGFNAIKFLQSENIFVLTEALRYHKQLSKSLVVVGDIIIGKSFDKPVKAGDIKVSTKRWRDRSQTQRYGGSGTGYSTLKSFCVWNCLRLYAISVYAYLRLHNYALDFIEAQEPLRRPGS